ncbi:5-formyltetrahydrofolate cyclo-ligase [Sporolactobacillus sp. CPB3-1]|uniref:5-formyltetrahydrofolate cyclo-ligase n=1 Tax=Sporolactobacillus mangiferae TaxID=2940498 RepID=A0ABT0M6B9_9BACL|nr:5-formyltetrahydrofolate cyclo-ligase [Sporolactobacillus mangiferae]MCL1630384.1 5-formyltetrahydrofolate cyclo-ligase [Sporolactobacillus mangiferae]
MNQKKLNIRNRILQQLERIDESVFTEQCKRIRDRLFATKIWQSADTVGITISIGREIETMAVITKAWTESKRVCVPKCNHKMHTLAFYELQTFSELESGFYGLMEPDPEKTKLVEPPSIDLLLVPGVAFDPQGYRIGYGGGYYDRLLNSYEGGTASLLLERQLIDELPIEPHDKPVDWMITESRCLSAKASENENMVHKPH